MYRGAAGVLEAALKVSGRELGCAVAGRGLRVTCGGEAAMVASCC